MLHTFIDIAQYLLWILTWVIIGQVILSWLIAFNVINIHSGGVRAFIIALDRLTAPLYRPIRHVLPDFGGLDFSPVVVLILIQVLQKLLTGIDAQYSYSGIA
jgi:YggT family protein